MRTWSSTCSQELIVPRHRFWKDASAYEPLRFRKKRSDQQNVFLGRVRCDIFHPTKQLELLQIFSALITSQDPHLNQRTQFVRFDNVFDNVLQISLSNLHILNIKNRCAYLDICDLFFSKKKQISNIRNKLNSFWEVHVYFSSPMTSFKTSHWVQNKTNLWGCGVVFFPGWCLPSVAMFSTGRLCMWAM